MRVRRLYAGMLLLLCLWPALPADAANRPNIVLILADDLGYGDVRALNPQGKIATPHLDRLAGEGMIFSDAHSSSAVCTPTRYGLLTGRYNWRSRLQSGVLAGISRPLIEPGRLTVAALLRQHGYHTAAIGKWHLGLDWPLRSGKRPSDDSQEDFARGWIFDFAQPIRNGARQLGFDYFFSLLRPVEQMPYVIIENERVVAIPRFGRKYGTTGPETNRSSPREASGTFGAADLLPTLTREAVAYVEGRAAEAGRGDPFFLYWPLMSPHTPIAPAPEWQGRSGLNTYADFVMQTDASVGELLQVLDRTGLATNTLVIFTSDNGCSPVANFEQLAAQGHRPSYVFRGGKADIFEGGHRIPLLVRWPGVVGAGTRCDELVGLNDFMATCAGIVGATLPDNAGEDSVSLLPLLSGRKTGPVHEALVHHASNGSFAIRQGRWKLALCGDSGGWSEPRPKNKGNRDVQLFDLQTDISETRNVAARHPDRVAKLNRLLEKYIADGRSTPGARQTNTVPVQIWK